jgi:hemolysin-activating ACP:hemolysin acyltransferase
MNMRLIAIKSVWVPSTVAPIGHPRKAKPRHKRGVLESITGSQFSSVSVAT